jgi:hypothetical protein
MNRSRFIPPLCRQRQPFVGAMAPTIVKLSPRFIGGASTNTSLCGSRCANGPSRDSRPIHRETPIAADLSGEANAPFGLDRGPVQFRWPQSFVS